MEYEMDEYEVVCKLIGPIDPVGDVHKDSERLVNLKKFVLLADKMLGKIDSVAYGHNDYHLHSCNEIRIYCREYLDRIGIEQ